LKHLKYEASYTFYNSSYCLSKYLQSFCEKRSSLAGTGEVFNMAIVLFLGKIKGFMGWSSCHAGLWPSSLEDKTQTRRKEPQRYEKQVLCLTPTPRCKFTAGATLVTYSETWREVPASGYLGHGFNQTAALRMASALLQMPPLYVEMYQKEKKKKNGRGNNMVGGWHRLQQSMG